MPFTYDLDIGSTRYFAGLEAGEVPLLLLFSGTVFGSADGKLQVQQVPWSKEAAYRLPVSVWREAIDAHFPNSAWIKMSRQTLDELQRFKTRHALPTWDATVCELLARADAEIGPAAMKVDSAHLAQARKVADAILYEGYLLYPYRQTAQKNQARFQFGVLMPPAYGVVDDCEPSASQTECLLECPDAAQVRVLVRFLQLRHRVVQAAAPGMRRAARRSPALTVGATEYTTWDEATEREQWAAVPVAELLSQDRNVEFHIGAGEASEDLIDSTGQQAGRLVRRWNGISGVIRLTAQRVAGPYGALRLRVRVENDTIPQAPMRSRDDGLQHAMIGTHALIWVPGGKFLSMTEPPEWAAAEVAACVNVGTWPVLAGPRDCQDLLLSSPVILYDHPEIAAESPGELFDATEIDEILTLRTLALTDAEKQQARATDPRAAQIMDRLDDMPPEMLERMHGAIRYLKSAPAGPGTGPVGQQAREQAQRTPPSGPGRSRGPPRATRRLRAGRRFRASRWFRARPRFRARSPAAPRCPGGIRVPIPRCRRKRITS